MPPRCPRCLDVNLYPTRQRRWWHALVALCGLRVYRCTSCRRLVVLPRWRRPAPRR